MQVVDQQRCNEHCLCDSVQAQQLKQQLRSAQVAGQWRGDTALTLPLFWRRSMVSPVFFGRFPWSSLHSVDPSQSVPVPNRPSRLHGRKAPGKQVPLSVGWLCWLVLNSNSRGNTVLQQTEVSMWQLTLGLGSGVRL